MMRTTYCQYSLIPEWNSIFQVKSSLFVLAEQPERAVTALVEHLHRAQTRNEIVGGQEVVQSFIFHTELVLKKLKYSQFHTQF